jgi:hypothetical protein
MATIITKNSSTASSVPSAAQLVQGELAVNVADKRLFTENSGGTVVELGTNPSSLALPNGTANGVTYLNGSKVLTSGSALTYNGAAMQINAASFPALKFGDSGATLKGEIYYGVGGNDLNIVNYANGPIGFSINSSEQMRLTSTGLGIGTSSITDKLTLGSGRIKIGTGGLALYVGNDGTDNALQLVSGTNIKFQSGSGYATNMLLDSSGNLGLGVTPSAWATVTPVFQVNRASFYGYSNEARMSANYYYNAGEKYIASDYATSYAQKNGQHQWYTAPSGTAGNAISFTQAMTLDASGNLLLATTTQDSGARFTLNDQGVVGISMVETGTTSHGRIYFKNGNGVVGQISTSGSATTYSTSSDYRLKENIQPMTGALAKVAALKPCIYNWKADGSDGEGFIAHELQAVVPQCVTGEKDAVDAEGNPVYQGIDTSFLVATLTAAIQELKAEFDAYKASHP